MKRNALYLVGFGILLVISGLFYYLQNNQNGINNQKFQQQKEQIKKSIEIKQLDISQKIDINKILENTATVNNPKEDLINQIKNICSQAQYSKQGKEACENILNEKSTLKVLNKNIINKLKEMYLGNK